MNLKKMTKFECKSLTRHRNDSLLKKMFFLNRYLYEHLKILEIQIGLDWVRLKNMIFRAEGKKRFKKQGF